MTVEGLRGLRLAVTAGAGFIGARIVRLAVEGGARVTVLSRTPGNRGRIAELAGVEVVDCDVLDDAAVAAVMKAARPEIVVHAAGLPDWRREPTLAPSMVRLHALGTTHVLEAARLAGAGRVVVVGSAGEYGDAAGPLAEDRTARPIDPYSVSKLAATEIALAYDRAFGLPCTVVRPFVVYGPGEPENRLLSTVFRRSLDGGGPTDFTRGEQVRDFVFVDDVAEGALRAAITPAAAGAILNLGTGVGTRVRDAVALAVEIAGATVKPVFGALPYRPGEPASLLADTTLCARVLGWSPATPLPRGLELAFEDLVHRLEGRA
jgi:nucleoside-diphosphate-sugar epimerase